MLELWTAQSSMVSHFGNPCCNHIPFYRAYEIHIFFVPGMMLATTTATMSGTVGMTTR
jgi:hypothetical protein